jgi:cytochrome c5
MNLKSTVKVLFLFCSASVFIACGGGGVKENAEQLDVQKLTENQPETHGTEIKESEITIANPVNAEWVTAGKNIYELKCQSCHKLTDEKLVGPGWKDVTKRRKPVWIMNMITNVDMMLETDAEAQKLLEQCMVRMPNQNISKEDARIILEFMRSNDGEK